MTFTPKFELIYFDATGRAEAIRIMLHAAGEEFIDTRLTFKDWPAIKPTTPLGCVPVLKIDGEAHCQSLALMRYAAKKGGFYPTDDLQALVVDEVADTIVELLSSIPKSKDTFEQEKLRQEYQAGNMKDYATFVEEKIQANGGCCVSGKSVTMTDLFLMSIVKLFQSGFVDHFDASFFDQFPGILATVKFASENEKVKEYYTSKA